SFTRDPQAALRVDVLRPVGALPPHITGLFEEAAAFQQAANGYYFVFDRRAHAIYMIDPDRANARKVVDVGQEEGRIIQPGGFDSAPDGSFVVADVPRGQERIQIFGAGVLRTGGFFLVFLTGQPMFRKYDANGKLLFERHIEGREIDDLLAAQPTKWPTRRVEDREVPFVQPMVRTAAVDPQGQLWVSMLVPYTY